MCHSLKEIVIVERIYSNLIYKFHKKNLIYKSEFENK